MSERCLRNQSIAAFFAVFLFPTAAVSQILATNLFPNIPQMEQNETAAAAIGRLQKLIEEENASYGEINEMAWGLCHPQSPLNGNESLARSLTRSIDRKMNRLGELNVDASGTWFEKSSQILEAYAMLKATFPDRISRPQRVRWEDAIRSHVNWIQNGPGAKFSKSPALVSLVNHDACWMLSLAYASLIFDQIEYKQLADAAVRMIAKSLLPDGGFAYVYEHNETFTYHQIVIKALARYWQISGSEIALDLVRGSYWYYPLSIEPRGTAEYSTAASWKQFWNTVSGVDGAFIVACLADSGENQTVASWGSPSPNLFMASFDRGTMKCVPSPDQYILYDANIMGPRGRFGSFSFSGTGSPYTNNRRGKQTFVGCMTVNGDKKGWDLNAALGAVYAAVKVEAGDIGYDVRTKKALVLSSQERNATTVTQHFAALSTRYQLSSYSSKKPEPWLGTQQWLFTANRIIGLVSLESLKEQMAYSMQLRLKFVSGRESWGTRKTFKPEGTDTYRYGDLNIAIHQTSFGGRRIRYTDTYTGDSQKCGEIILLDSQSHRTNEQEPLVFAAHQKQFALVEIYPRTSTPASNVQCKTLSNGLIEIQLDDAEKRLILVHNPTDHPVRHAMHAQDKTQFTVHPSGGKFRPKWIGTHRGHKFPDHRMLHAGPEQVVSASHATASSASHERIIPANTHFVYASGSP
ncbi:MAG: hypothetical protein AAF802_17930 [Planctomycetota bacterium]